MSHHREHVPQARYLAATFLAAVAASLTDSFRTDPAAAGGGGGRPGGGGGGGPPGEPALGRYPLQGCVRGLNALPPTRMCTTTPRMCTRARGAPEHTYTWQS